MRKTRLMIVGSFPPVGRVVYGGITTSCRVLLASSFSSRYDLITVDSTQISNPPPGVLIRSLFAIKRMILFNTLLAKNRPDVLLLFTSSGLSIAEKGLMARLSKFFGVTSLIFPRGGGLIDTSKKSVTYRLLSTYFLRGADYMICQGPNWQRYAVNVVGLDESRSPIVYNWTATRRLLDIGRNRVFNSAATNLQLLFLAWLEESKGIFELLEALNQLNTLFDFELVVAGSGNAENAAREFVVRNKLQHRVKFVGWADNAQKENLLSNCDIFVLPSWQEGFPNAVIEAMSAKIPVVTTTVGNIPDILTHGKHAYIVQPKDVLALKTALEALFRSANLRFALAEEGFSFACKNFSEEACLDRLASVVDIAASSRGH